ncbi:tetratricopeptide repeat protein [Flavobacterium jejuense]|uniref:Tetratricopeptide repeat protein n=1 Tax=Flavobacterium jejuense TaxID=1544455 RepID=A0ABX0IM89_9FLAO|nr:tetratricopeptide repeat protein [Flavobacterium jejuense]NHN24087.1 tetratricopeptide repeat protein [Flavobacterium jejuense]
MNFLRFLLSQSERYLFLRKFAFYFVVILSVHFAAAAESQEEKPLDSLLIQLKKHKKKDTIQINFLNAIGYKYWIIDAKESIRYGEQALQLSEQLSYAFGLAKANRIIGVAYWSQGFQNKALAYLKVSHELYKKNNDKAGIANTRLNLGMVYADLKNYKKALHYYELAIDEFTALALKGRIATTFTKMGTMFIEQHKNTEALKYLTDALQMHIDDDYTYGIAEVHNKLGILYLNKNEIELASYHIKKSMEIGKKVNDIHGLTNNLILSGKILRLRNRIDEATKSVEKGLLLAQENNLKQFELVAYEELKELKKQQHKPYEALAFYEKYESLKDSLFTLEKSKQIAYIEFENELEKKNNELSKLEAHEKASEIINLILIIGIVILSLAGYIIYYVSQQRLRKSKQLALKNKEYLESEQALTQKELENSELKRQELRQQLDFKNRELTSYALNFIKKNEVVQELQLTINTLKESSAINKDKLIADLKKIIRKNLSIDRDWEDFSRFFDDVHQGFYSNLKMNHKSLTVNDLKLCSLIRLNLNTKETASILGISPESAKTARYRLRQKLGIDAKQDIANYLVNLEFEPNSKT